MRRNVRFLLAVVAVFGLALTAPVADALPVRTNAAATTRIHTKSLDKYLHKCNAISKSAVGALYDDGYESGKLVDPGLGRRLSPVHTIFKHSKYYNDCRFVTHVSSLSSRIPIFYIRWTTNPKYVAAYNTKTPGDNIVYTRAPAGFTQEYSNGGDNLHLYNPHVWIFVSSLTTTFHPSSKIAKSFIYKASKCIRTAHCR